MKSCFSRACLLAASLGLAAPAFASQPVSLLDALKEAERSSPRLKGERFLEQASAEQVRSARSGYLPSLDAAAIASDGNPGAFSLLGVDANYGASQRIGEGGALILRQTIWDFGRTAAAVENAQLNQDLEARIMGLSQADLALQVLRSYLDCAVLKSEAADFRFTAEQARVIAHETDRYVKSGQRSVVERYLVEQQAAEADRSSAELLAKLQLVERRLAIELGRPETEAVDCEDLEANADAVARFAGNEVTNPAVAVSEQRARLARSRLGQAKAERRPVLLGVVEGGYFKDNLIVPRWNYSAGVGVSFPLFTGFRLDADVARASAEASARDADLEYTHQTVAEAATRYQEQIAAKQVALRYLAGEAETADKAFKLAKQRYFSLQGTMVDLREALRNLDQVHIDTEEARRDLLLGQGGLALFNGARP